jgi:hypothetical protein
MDRAGMADLSAVRIGTPGLPGRGACCEHLRCFLPHPQEPGSSPSENRAIFRKQPVAFRKRGASPLLKSPALAKLAVREIFFVTALVSIALAQFSYIVSDRAADSYVLGFLL